MSTSTIELPAEDETVETIELAVCLPVCVANCPMTGRQDCNGADSARCPAC